jgi:hypothetical protein
MSKRKLLNQLRESGASKKEAAELAGIAAILTKNAPSSSLSNIQKKQIAKDIGFGRERFTFRTFALAAYAVVAAFLIVPVVVAQFSLPGDPLYFVKRGTEAVRSVIQPSFADKASERRKEELNDLKATGASNDVIQKAEQEAEKSEDKKSSSSNDSNDSTSTNSTEDSKHDDAPSSQSTSPSSTSSQTQTQNQTQTQTQTQNHGGTTNTQTPPSSTISSDQAVVIAKAKMQQLATEKTFESVSGPTSINGVLAYQCKFSKGGEVIVRASDGFIISSKP